MLYKTINYDCYFVLIDKCQNILTSYASLAVLRNSPLRYYRHSTNDISENELIM